MPERVRVNPFIAIMTSTDVKVVATAAEVRQPADGVRV